jgi:hypothetical protein
MGDQYTSDSLVCRTRVAIGASGRDGARTVGAERARARRETASRSSWGRAANNSVSVSVETRRSDDLYTGSSPDGDGVEAERWPLLGGDGGRKEMGRGRLEVLVDNAWRTHVGRRGGEGCYDTYRSVLYRDPRASPWPLRVTGVSYARARQRPGGLTVSPHARFGTASGGGRKCGEKRRGVGRRAAPRTAGHPSRGRDTCGSEG